MSDSFIMQMQPYWFDEIDTHSGKITKTNLIGMIAEDMPDERLIVYEEETGKIGNYDDRAVISLLVNATKEQQGLIEKLYKRIEILENRCNLGDEGN